MSVVISADRTCDLTQDMLEANDVKTIPYHIVLDEKEYLDNIDINLTQIFDAYEDHGSLPRTSAISPSEYRKHFTKLREEHGKDCEIVHITLGSALTSSYEHCCEAAEELGGIYAVDSCTLSSATGLQVLDAVKLAKEGKSAKEIKDYLDEHKQCYHASFVVNTLEYLKAGGRCSSVAAVAAAAFNIKPSIVVDGYNKGAMTVGKKYRGKLEKVIKQYVHDKLEQYSDIDYSECMITSSAQVDGIDDHKIVREILENETEFKTIYDTHASCTIGCHCGPGTIGILFRTKTNSL